MKFEGKQEDRVMVDLIYDISINKYHIKEKDFFKTFDAIKEYCIKNNRATFEYVWKYLIASKLLNKYSFDIDALKEEARQIIDDFNKLIQELMESEKENGID